MGNVFNFFLNSLEIREKTMTIFVITTLFKKGCEYILFQLFEENLKDQQAAD